MKWFEKIKSEVSKITRTQMVVAVMMYWTGLVWINVTQMVGMTAVMLTIGSPVIVPAVALIIDLYSKNAELRRRVAALEEGVKRG